MKCIWDSIMLYFVAPVLYAMLFFMLNFTLNKFLLNKITPQIILILVPRLISFIHSLTAFTYAEIYEVYSDYFVLLSAGYFTYDLLNTFNKKITKESTVNIIHHMFALMSYYVVLTDIDIRKSMPILTFIVGKIELTSAISHMVVILDLLQYKRGIVILKIFNIVLWIYYRLISVYLLHESLFVGSLIYSFIAIIIISMAGLGTIIKNLFEK